MLKKLIFLLTTGMTFGISSLSHSTFTFKTFNGSCDVLSKPDSPVLIKAFNREGFEVISIQTKPSSLKEVRKAEVDIVDAIRLALKENESSQVFLMLDNSMGKMRGTESIQKIRTLVDHFTEKNNPRVKYILHSSKDFSGEPVRFFDYSIQKTSPKTSFEQLMELAHKEAPETEGRSKKVIILVDDDQIIIKMHPYYYVKELLQ